MIAFFVSFISVLKWGFSNYGKKKVLIADILNVSVTWGAFLASKFTGQKMAVIVTDLPEHLVDGAEGQVFFRKVFLKLNTYILNRYDFYIGLTPQMNHVINPYNKPFLVMEGLVDSNAPLIKEKWVSSTKVVLYAGGIYEKYGVKNLIEGFMELKDPNAELHIYGSGDLQGKMPSYIAEDARIRYFGVVSNSHILTKLSEATLLINPRPTTEEFTKYSFPSKNMEYMVSGTPLITTRLPGMPQEYLPYVYLIEDESVGGIQKILSELLNKDPNKLKAFGSVARNWILDNKSNEMQAAKIIQFLNSTV